MIKCVDAHHHFWTYSSAEYGWIDDTMHMLRRDFLPHDLLIEIEAAGVQETIVVQARQTLEETRWLLNLASDYSFVAGVIGWAPIGSPGFPAELESLDLEPKLKGLRHVLQDEPNGAYMLSDTFLRGIALLKGKGLVYDILIRERQLPYATRLVDLYPDQIFVLDHLAKPRICTGEISPWRERLRELALRPNVYCKLSGLVTEADWNKWAIGDLRPYVEVALDCFGPQRLLAGSDWPVCIAASSYQMWWHCLRELLSDLSPFEFGSVFGGNAIQVYGLNGDKQ